MKDNFKTKKELKAAVKAGDSVLIFQPGPFGSGVRDMVHLTEKPGECSVEGPHYPKPHTWYARVRVEAGQVVKVLS